MISYEMLWVYLCKPGGNKKHFSNHHFTIYRSEKADVTRCNQWIMIEITQSHVDLPNPLTENFCAFYMDPWEIPPLPCSQRHLRSWNGLAKLLQTALEQTLLYSLVNFKIAGINLYISSPGILMFLMATRPTRGDGEKKKTGPRSRFQRSEIGTKKLVVLEVSCADPAPPDTRYPRVEKVTRVEDGKILPEISRNMVREFTCWSTRTQVSQDPTKPNIKGFESQNFAQISDLVNFVNMTRSSRNS